MNANLNQTATEPTIEATTTTAAEKTRVHYKPQFAPKNNVHEHEEELDTVILSPVNNGVKLDAKRPFWFQVAQTMGTLGSIGWVLVCIAYYTLEGGWVSQTPYEFGVFMAGILAPIAFYWMLLSYLQRKSDVEYYADSLRAEMHSLFFTSGDDTRRVNKDIEIMMRQAAELATSSKTVMKAIQKTRHGLREEIKEFASFASKAEGHMVSLSDTLSDRVHGVSEMVDVIKQRVELIDGVSQQSITSWDAASAKMLERANDIEGTMEHGAQSLMAVADLAEDKSKSVADMFDGTITSLGMTVDAVINRLGNMNEEFGAHTRSLSISTEELSKETERVRVMIDDHTEILKDATGHAVENITTALLKLSDHSDMFVKTSDDLIGKTNNLADAVNTSLTQLNDTTENIVNRSESIGHRIAEKSTLIADVMSGFDEQIDRMDSTSKTAAHRLTESIETVYSSSSEISDATRKASELLILTSETTKDDAQYLIEKMTDHVGHLENTSRQNKVMIDAMDETMDNIHQKIEGSSRVVKNHISVLNETFDKQTSDIQKSTMDICDQIIHATHSIEEPMRQMSIVVAEADTRHEQIETTLASRIESIQEASVKATENVETIRVSLREQTHDISSLSGRVLQQSKSLNEEMSLQKTDLNDMIISNTDTIENYVDRLTATQNQIANVSQELSVVVSTINENLVSGLTSMQDGSVEATDILRSTSVTFEQKIGDFNQTLKGAYTNLSNANDVLVQNSETIMPLYETIGENANKATTALDEYKEEFETLTTVAGDKINQAALKLDDHLTKLKQGADNTALVINHSTTALKDRINDIDTSIEISQNRMDAVTTSMVSQGENIHILTDKAILKIDSVQNVLQNQFQELSESVGLSVSQIEEAGERFTVRASKISQESDVIVSRIHNVGDEAQAKAYEMKQASQNIADVTTESAQSMMIEIDAMTAHSDKALMNLQKTSDTLSIKSKEIDASAESVLNQARSYVVDVRDQIGGIALKSADTATQIGHSVSTLVQTMDKVTDKTKTAVDYIRDTNQTLFVQSGQFIASVSKSTDVVTDSTQNFIEQTDNLLKASRVAENRIEQIRNNELQACQKSFLSSARFVLESLHSLSIDFVRMIDGDVADKDWKSYQKGDVAVFSTKLAQRLGDLPSDKIRTKFEEDSEFRNYVQKFMRQFEDILEQTDSVDKGAILGAIFGSSDIGKIYRYLGNVTGRAMKDTQGA